jgi:serine/threonine-protein kinase
MQNAKGRTMKNISGQTLGSYRLLEKLGDGGMAEVYLAEHLHLNRHVAIKFIRPELSQEETFRHRFEREARIAARLSHPNIVHIFDFGAFQDRHYLIMEYIRGITLKEYLKSTVSAGAILSLDEIIAIIAQISQALDYVHHAGIIHRDIKPDNILLTPDGRACLSDFGVARYVGADGNHTGTGLILGTPTYMSPEHILSDGPCLSPASDIYSLGVILYELLTGKPPFTANTPILIMLKHLSAPIPDLSAPLLDIPDSLEDVIQKVLAKDPLERYQSAGLFLRDLKECLEKTVRFSRLHPEPAIC